MRVLVADDDPAIRSLIERQLQSGGFEVLLAADGQEAWAALRGTPIPIAILDWHMPHMAGVEVCQRLQKLRHPTYAIILTGKEDQGATAQALDAGASDFMTKPWMGDVLLGRVRVAARIVALQSELAQAQKLEAIGQLAAGIAHEINTPMQFLGNNARFLQSAFQDLANLLTKYAQLAQAGRSRCVTPELLDEIDAARQEADVAYLTREIPDAIAQSLDGIDRVTNIVLAMKHFSQSGSGNKEPVALNQAIQDTITVSANEWRHVAEMVTEFDSTLPPITCLAGEIKQVMLNVILNAARAIANALGPKTDEKGTITISTRLDGDYVEVRIADTGTGIPQEHRLSVFDPFFTTKEVGQGTGQGLSLAHAVVADNHQGTITFETAVRKGTTFIIRLPIHSESDRLQETPIHEAANSLC